VERLEANTRDNINAINANTVNISTLDANVHVLRRGDEEKVRKKIAKNFLIHGISELADENHHNEGLKFLASLGFLATDQLEVNTVRQGHPYPGRTTIRPLRLTFALMEDKINFRKDFIFTQHPDLQRLKTSPYLTDHLTPLQQHEMKLPVIVGPNTSIIPPILKTVVGTTDSTVQQPQTGSTTTLLNTGARKNVTTTTRRGRPPGSLKRVADAQAGSSDSLESETGLLPAKKLKSQKFIGRKHTAKKNADPASSTQPH
jgi:hypothetical protein